MVVVEVPQGADREQLAAGTEAEEQDRRVEQALEVERVRVLGRRLRPGEGQVALEQLPDVRGSRIVERDRAVGRHADIVTRRRSGVERLQGPRRPDQTVRSSAIRRSSTYSPSRKNSPRSTLRVFAPNAAARALYDAAGFEVEGVLRGEFFLEGEYVDDLLMALDLTV